MAQDKFAMQPTEFAELRAAASAVGLQDVHLGRVLDLLVLHLGHAHGLDPAAEDARLADEARKAARDAEDARLKQEVDDREKARISEDAQPRTPEQQALLASTRAAEDVQVKADAEALAKAREEEDAKAASTVTAEQAAPSFEPTQEGTS